MLVATFGPSTGWAGKTITREGDVFVLEDHGPITAANVMEYDRQGQLVWVNDGTRAWTGAKAQGAGSAEGQGTGAVWAAPTLKPQPEVPAWRYVVGLSLFALVIVLGVYACGGCGCGCGSMSADEAVSRLTATTTDGEGVWGQMPGTSLEMIAVKDSSGYLVSSRMDSNSSWTSGTSYYSAQAAVDAMVSGGSITSFKPYP